MFPSRNPQRTAPNHKEEFPGPRLACEVVAPDPHVFIGEHSELLRASAGAWADVARTVQDFRMTHTPDIQVGLASIRTATDISSPADMERIGQEADEFGLRLSLYWALSARKLSSEQIHLWSTKNELVDRFIEIPDPTFDYIVNDILPVRSIILNQIKLMKSMYDADNKGKNVLYGLLEHYKEQPTELVTLAGLFLNDEAASMDRRYAELQRIIATDWHHPDQSRSILRTFCEESLASPEAFIPEFIRHITDSEKSKASEHLRNMAAFAILAAGAGKQTITHEEIQNVFWRTRTRWGEIDDIETQFQSYMSQKVGQIRDALSSIAGVRNPRGIRTYPSASEIDVLQSSLSANYLPGGVARRERRKKERTEKNLHGQVVLLLPQA